ncbi:MAG: hypothetical protein FJ030_05620 [Chloroflexi bacterium]|nr:hypothetical protein [Chloroflexota bacterium]
MVRALAKIQKFRLKLRAVEDNGLIVVDDPSTLIYLGYGFQNPKPGVWKVTLQTTDFTPDSGADYALSAQYVGGATLKATASTLLPAVNESVSITVSLDLGGQPLSLDSAQAIVHRPDGTSETVALPITGSQASTDWTPTEAGLYGVDIQVAGRAPDGAAIERAAFLTIEAQPVNRPTAKNLAMIGGGVAIVITMIAGAAMMIAVLLRVALRKKRSR